MALLEQLSPTVIGACIALAGTILLFALQQAAVRRERREERRLQAAEHLMSTLVAASRAYSRNSSTDRASAFQDMIVMSWRFAWLLDRRERPVADWAWEVLFKRAADAAKVKGRAARDVELTKVIAEVMTGLNHWRTGERPLNWFRQESVQLRQEREARTAPSAAT